MEFITNISKLNSKNLLSYLKNLDQDKLSEILSILDNHYYNGESLVKDKIYDKMQLYYDEKYANKNNEWDAHSKIKLSGTKFKLPFYHGSMDKMKYGTTTLKNFLKKFGSEEIVVMEKLDGIHIGVSFEDEYPNVYTRGRGDYGTLVNNAIDFIPSLKKIKKLKKLFNTKTYLRGELLISKKQWEKIKDLGKNARNFVSGTISKKTPDEKKLSYMTFVPFDFISEKKLKKSEQLKELKKMGFPQIQHKIYTKIIEDDLENILSDFKNKSLYEIDGIILENNKYTAIPKSGNPKHAKAFKSENFNDSVITIITNIEWKPTKNGSIKPVAEFKSVSLGGTSTSRAYLYNASNVVKLGIGIGSQVRVVRSGDVIPKITEVIVKKKVILPKEYNYKWDDNKVDIILINPNENDDVAKDIIGHFVKTTEIEFFKKGMIKKAFDKDFKTILNIISMKEKDFLKIDGVKEKSAKKIFKSFKLNLNNIPIWKLAAASEYFDNLGKKRLKLIFDKLPDVLEKSNIHEIEKKIIEIDGFSEITSNNFVTDLNNFKNFVTKYEKFYKIQYLDNKKDDNDGLLLGISFLFTGKIDKELKSKIILNSGEVSKTFSKKLNYLIAFDKDSNSDKIKKAKKNNIQILSHTDLKNLLKNIYNIV
jgi:DNA ligase (NAD+)